MHIWQIIHPFIFVHYSVYIYISLNLYFRSPVLKSLLMRNQWKSRQRGRYLRMGEGLLHRLISHLQIIQRFTWLRIYTYDLSFRRMLSLMLLLTHCFCLCFDENKMMLIFQRAFLTLCLEIWVFMWGLGNLIHMKKYKQEASMWRPKFSLTVLITVSFFYYFFQLSDKCMHSIDSGALVCNCQINISN